jgi:hypothetical protein
MLTGISHAADAWEDWQVMPYYGAGNRVVEMEPVSGTDRLGILLGSGTLRYAEGAEGSWDYTTVASGINTGSGMRVGLAFDPATHAPYASYQDDAGVQYVSCYTGSAWVADVVTASGAAGGSSLAIDPLSAEPAVAFGGGGSISFAWHDIAGWHTEVVQSAFGGFHEPSLRYDPLTGEACLAYAATFDGVYFARRSSSGVWTRQRVVATTFPNSPVLQFSPDGNQPAIAYVGSSVAPVYYAEYSGAVWDISQVTEFNVGHPIGMDHLSDGTPLVVYPAEDASFKIAILDEGVWRTYSQHYCESWAYTMDLLVDEPYASVVYEGTDIGIHYAQTIIPEPLSLVFFGTGVAGAFGFVARRKLARKA